MRAVICSSSKKALLAPRLFPLLLRHYPADLSVVTEGMNLTPVSHFGRLAFLFVVFCGMAPNCAGAVLRPISAHSPTGPVNRNGGT